MSEITLGYLINKSENEKALNYLINGVNLDTWSSKKMNWVSPYQINVNDRNKQLSKLAIAGLALSGNPEAENTLKSIIRADTYQQFKNREELGVDFIKTALKDCAKVSKKGLLKYNEEISKKCKSNI